MGWFRRSKPAEERAFGQDANRIPTWAEASAGLGYAPMPITRDTAIGLPAVGRAISLVAETCASLPLEVYQGTGANKRLRDDTWQYRLLHDLPGIGDFTSFDLFSDIAACLEASGNAFVQKVKAAGEVIALIVIDPRRVEVYRNGGEKRFKVLDEEGRQQDYGTSTILHIRGFTVNGSDMGLSPIAVHRQRIGFASAQEQYMARFYGQGVGKRIAVQVPGPLTNDQAKTMVDTIVASKAGLANSHLPMLLTNGATLADAGMSLEDAQYVESERMNLLQAAHIFKLPPKFLTGDGDLSEWDFIYLNTVAIAPRLKRIAAALYADPDLFPDRVLYPEFRIRDLARTDAKTQAEVEHMQIQDGTLLKDEARAERGLPPLVMPEDPEANPGMVPLLTPTGAAPNPTPPGSSDEDRAVNITVQPAAAPDVRVAAPQVHVAAPQVRLEPRIDVQAAPAPNVTVEAPPPAEVRNEFTIEAAPAPHVTVQAPPPAEVHNEFTIEAGRTPNVVVEAPPPAEVRAEINVQPPPIPDVHVTVPAPGRIKRTLVRDDDGAITGSVEEIVED
jgi:HK97 family phage portal protein